MSQPHDHPLHPARRDLAASNLPLWAILFVTALLYLPTLRFGFVYDDPIQIIDNPRLASWSFVPSYFQHHIWIHISQTGSYYRPLFLLWLRLNFALFGTHSVLWHASTLFLHLVAVALVYLLLRKIIPSPLVVTIATAVFALHPAHIESVAWISGLTDPLMTIPLVGSLLCWLTYRERNKIIWLIAALALYLAALMVKETAAIVPVLAFVIVYALDKLANLPALRRATTAFSLYLLVFVAYWIIRGRILRHEFAAAIRPANSALYNLPAMAWFYVRHLVWPANLSVIYDFELTHNLIALAAAVVIVLLVFALAIWLAVTIRPGAKPDASSPAFALIALAWIVLPIAAAIAGTPMFDPHDYVHDRYLYLAAIGFGILIGLFVQRLRFGKAQLFQRPAIQTVATLLVFSALAFATEVQLSPWAGNLTLFAHAVQAAPRNPLAYEHLAFEMYRRQDPETTIALYKKAIELDPNDWRANFGIAVMYFRLQNWQRVDEYCGRANAIDSTSNNACLQFQTIARMNLGHWESAEQPIRVAIAHWPQEPGQHLLLGRILVHLGDVPDARRAFETELQLNPASSDAQAELAQLAPVTPANNH